jgi:hypothetical protein
LFFQVAIPWSQRASCRILGVTHFDTSFKCSRNLSFLRAARASALTNPLPNFELIRALEKRRFFLFNLPFLRARFATGFSFDLMLSPFPQTAAE